MRVKKNPKISSKRVPKNSKNAVRGQKQRCFQISKKWSVFFPQMVCFWSVFRLKIGLFLVCFFTLVVWFNNWQHWYYTVVLNLLLYFTVLYCTVVLHCLSTVLNYTVLSSMYYSTVLAYYCTVVIHLLLYCTV